MDIHRINTMTIDTMTITYVGYADRSVPFNDLLQVVAASVTVATEMKAECPVRRHRGSANHSTVLLHHIVWPRTEEDGDVDYTTDRTERQRRQGLKDDI